MAQALEPSSFEEAAAALAAATAAGRRIRIRGAGTKLGWGCVVPEPEVELRTTALDRIIEHNEGDLTAVLEAGVPLARAQEVFASANQMLALDPPLGSHDRGATIGGVLATGDCGPLRHRYGAPRDLVVGMTVALSDGTIARSGGKVIKNVAGYDLPKLFAGSFGTLGLILSVSVRLHPRPVATATTLGAHGNPDVLASAARRLVAAPLELEALDIAWHAGRGGILAQAGGAEAVRRAQRAAGLMREAGLEQVDIATEDEWLWARQRAGQRSREQALLKVSARPSLLADLLRATDRYEATLVGRGALGCCYIEVRPEAARALQEELGAGVAAILLDGPAELRSSLDPWGTGDAARLELMKRLKHRFDPAHSCNPGIFVGGI